MSVHILQQHSLDSTGFVDRYIRMMKDTITRYNSVLRDREKGKGGSLKGQQERPTTTISTCHDVP